MELSNVDLLCLDAGNVIVLLDHARLGKLVGIEKEKLVVSEGKSKHALERGTLQDVSWTRGQVPRWRQWGRVMATILHGAGVPLGEIPAMLELLCKEHEALNLWSRVPGDLRDALVSLRRTGVRVVVVSNSEGNLETLFDRLGLLDAFDLVLDSGKIGVEKPDPRIFHMALEHAGSSPDRALHLGDTYATDVVGARAAGIRVALVDPHNHYEGRHLDVPRVPGAGHVARMIARTRSM